MATAGQVAVTKCDICAKNSGTLFCYSCNHYFCQSCELFHQKFPSTKHHKVINSQDINKLVVNNKHVCEDHKQDYNLFCTTCDCLICTMCVTTQHNGHSFKALSTVADETRAIVEENIFLLKDKKSNISELIVDIKLNKLTKMEENLNIYSQQVEETTKGISQIVESVSRIDVTRVTDRYLVQRQQAEYTLSELERLSRESSSLLEKSEQIMSVEHDVTFILSKTTLAKELTEIEIPCLDELKLDETFSEEHFVESLIDKMQNHYKLKRQSELESKVSALEDKITVLKDKGKSLQAEVHAESEAKEKWQNEKDDYVQCIKQLQMQVDELQSERQHVENYWLNHYGGLSKK